MSYDFTVTAHTVLLTSAVQFQYFEVMRVSDPLLVVVSKLKFLDSRFGISIKANMQCGFNRQTAFERTYLRLKHELLE